MDLAQQISGMLCEEAGPVVKARRSDHGVNHFDIDNGGEAAIRVYSVNEEKTDLESLEDAASLAAFYNAKFFHELVVTEKVGVQVPRLTISFKKGDVVCFATEDKTANTARMAELGFHELTQVAEQLAFLHAIRVIDDVRTTINDNHAVVWEQTVERIDRRLETGISSIESELRVFFSRPDEIRSKLRALHAEHLHISPRLSVLCHGSLTGERCSFDDAGHLVQIDGWESVHTGHPIEDLVSLIVSSASPETRRRDYMKIIRHYFYALVDMRAPHLMLADLRAAFKASMGAVVLANLDHLIDQLACPVRFTSDIKHILARRWESALDDAYAVAIGEYESDNEQSFFK